MCSTCNNTLEKYQPNGKVLVFILNGKYRVEVWEKDSLGHYPIFTKNYDTKSEAESEANDWCLSGYEILQEGVHKNCKKCQQYLSKEEHLLCDACKYEEKQKEGLRRQEK